MLRRKKKMSRRRVKKSRRVKVETVKTNSGLYIMALCHQFSMKQMLMYPQLAPGKSPAHKPPHEAYIKGQCCEECLQFCLVKEASMMHSAAFIAILLLVTGYFSAGGSADMDSKETHIQKTAHSWKPILVMHEVRNGNMSTSSPVEVYTPSQPAMVPTSRHFITAQL